jgi:hypothetical protein
MSVVPCKNWLSWAMASTHFGREGMWWIHLNSMDVQVCLCGYMVYLLPSGA